MVCVKKKDVHCFCLLPLNGSRYVWLAMEPAAIDTLLAAANSFITNILYEDIEQMKETNMFQYLLQREKNGNLVNLRIRKVKRSNFWSCCLLICVFFCCCSNLLGNVTQCSFATNSMMMF